VTVRGPGGYDRGMARTVGLVTAAAAATLGVAAPAAGQDAADREALAERLADADAAIARGLVATARWAERKDLHAEALDAYLVALGYDPDDRRARRALGYTGEPGDWTLDAGRVARLERENDVDGRRLDRLLADLKERRREDAAEALEELREVAAWAEDRHPELAPRAWRRLLAFDPDDREAREALGYMRLASRSWVLVAEVQRMEAAPRGEPTGPGPIARRTGLDLEARAAGPLRVTGDVGDDELGRLLRWAGAARDLFRERVGDPGEVELTIAFFAERAPYRRFVETSRPDDEPAFRRRVAEELGGAPSTVDASYAYCEDDPFDRADGAVRQVAIYYLLGLQGDAPERLPWLEEGLAAWFTHRLHGSVRYKGVGRGTRAPGRTSNDPERWPRRVRALAGSGQGVPMAHLLTNRSRNAFRVDDLAKAWSLIDYLLAERPDALRAIAPAMTEGVDVLAVVEEALGQDAAALEAAWRAWVLERY